MTKMKWMKIKYDVLHQNCTTNIYKCRLSLLFSHILIIRMQNKRKIHKSFGFRKEILNYKYIENRIGHLLHFLKKQQLLYKLSINTLQRNQHNDLSLRNLSGHGSGPLTRGDAVSS